MILKQKGEMMTIEDLDQTPDYERLEVFLASLDTPEQPYLEQLAKTAREDGVPIIRDAMRSFLEVYLELIHPAAILEVGAAVGYSALLMAAHTSAECRIDTIELDPGRAAAARKNIAACGMESRIHLHEGDAADILPKLEGSYDMVFMDAAKGQYPHFLPETLRLLRRGGVLITDNVLQEGSILDSRFAVSRRDRTIHKRMREYLWELKHHPQLLTTIVPVGDGAAVSIKCERKENEFTADAFGRMPEK